MVGVPENFGELLKSIGRSLPRQKRQRPAVKAVGRNWRAEYREYYTGPDGKEASRHKAATWPKHFFSKAEAQAECDALIRELREGPRPGASMTVADLWEQIYLPTRERRWEPQTRAAAMYQWRRHIEPVLGNLKLADVKKFVIELQLVNMAESGLRRATLQGVLVRIHSIMDEALENGFIGKNPARKIDLPRCQPQEETRSLTLEEVRRLLASVEDGDRLVWRILLGTGIRIGELLALSRDDITADGLRIDESALVGQASSTKNHKTRVVPLAGSLRAEIAEHLSHHANNLLFTTPAGGMLRRSGMRMAGVLKRARDAAGIPDLTFRTCRTSFATLIEADPRDLQEIMGHHSPDFTLRVYVRSIPERAQAAIDAMEARLRGGVDR